MKWLFCFLIDLIKPFDGAIFYKLRRVFYRRIGLKMGRDVKIKTNVILEYPNGVKIGNRVSIQHGVFISGYGGVEIGDDVSIAHSVSILSSDHDYKSSDIIRNATLNRKSTKIGSNVWIGMKASILSGVTIGNNVIIGAHALVNRDVAGGMIVAGIPIKTIGTYR